MLRKLRKGLKCRGDFEETVVENVDRFLIFSQITSIIKRFKIFIRGDLC